MIALLILTGLVVGLPILLIGVNCALDDDKEAIVVAFLCFAMVGCLVASGISLYVNRFKPLVEPLTVEMKV